MPLPAGWVNMAFMRPYPSSSTQWSIGRPWTPAVRTLILTNLGVFLLQMVFSGHPLLTRLMLEVPAVFTSARWWQPVTYLFLHGGFWHLAFNMLTLWMFGCDVEERLGSRWFTWYYLACGVGAGWCVAGVGWLAHETSVTLGASGAIFGVLLAFGVLFADRVITLLVFFILPVTLKARTMVLLFGAFEFFAGVGQALGRVSHLAHLSGLLIGYLFFWVRWPQAVEGFIPWRRWRPPWSRPRLHIAPSESEVDAILEKISRQGMSSLTRQEREILNRASQKAYDSRQDRSN
ncbi:MAG: rhomboid family intramembrane serine protease [candidate division FCPU426 bacterium]